MNMKRVLRDIETGRTNLAKVGIHICPKEDKLTDIHFLMPGPVGTPYVGGLYHGLLRLSDDHPMSPVSLHMFTPSGRFELSNQPVPKTDQGICTTNTVYHKSDWTPMNTIETLLIGFQSFMSGDNEGGIKSIVRSEKKRKDLAAASHAHLRGDAVARALFPDVIASLDHNNKNA